MGQSHSKCITDVNLGRFCFLDSLTRAQDETFRSKIGNARAERERRLQTKTYFRNLRALYVLHMCVCAVRVQQFTH